MLGWEYPPRMAGGLGKACQGLAQAMARRGVQLYFVLPSFADRVSEPKLEVVGAQECMKEAGWDVDVRAAGLGGAHVPGQPSTAVGAFASGVSATLSSVSAFGAAASGPSGAQAGGWIQAIQSEAKLFPYGAHPQDPLPAGVESMIRRLAEAQPIQKEALKRALQKISPPEHGVRQVSDHRAANKEIYGRNLWSEIEKFCFTARHLADAHETDVVHAHDWMTFPAAFEVQRVTGAPVFLHVHATEYDRSGDNLNHDVFRIEREGFRRATHIFAVSRYTAGIIERLYGVNRKKISVIYNAPEHDASEVLAPPSAPRRPDVVFLGRLTFQKGPDHFISAAGLVAKANPRARFVVCGTGDMMDQLRAQAHSLGIEDRVHFAGFVDPAGVDAILSRSKVLVMPSVSEPFGLVALEAIRCGIPVILSKQSGVREVLSRALQVDFWDIDKLADHINAALRLPDLSRQLVQEGIGQIQSLSWDRSAAKVIQTYHKYVPRTYAQAIGGAHGH
jgi:glycosyltransferase involved in cell wall biosynthesis